MKNYFNKVLISCIFCILLLSSCSSSPSVASNLSAENESLIKEITNGYLIEITSGVFASEMYNSKFSPSLVIDELDFNQPQAQALMNENMTHIEFKIYGVNSANETFRDIFDKRIKANCLVEVSVIDIENSLKKLNNPLLGYADLIKLLPSSNRTSIMKKNIAIQLAYNEEGGKWEIIDSSQLMKLIIEPYKKITLPNPTSELYTIINEFIESVRSVDIDKIVDLTDNYNQHILSDNFDKLFYKNTLSLEDAKKIFPYIKIEVTSDYNFLPDDANSYGLGAVKIPIRLSFPNIEDSLIKLGHKASLEELVSLLKKCDENNRVILLEDLFLEIEGNPNTQTWYLVDYGNFKSISMKMYSYICKYTDLSGPPKTTD